MEKTVVEFIRAREVQRMHRELLHITQPHDAYCVDTRSLKIVQEAEVQAVTVLGTSGYR